MADLINPKKTSISSVHHESQPVWYSGERGKREVDLWEYFRIIWKRKWLLLVVVLIVVGAVAIQTFRATPLYRAAVKIQIGPLEQVLPYQKLYKANPEKDPRNNIFTQIQVLRSLNLSRRVAQHLWDTDSSEKISSRAKSLLNNLEVTPLPGTEIVRVSFSSQDPKFAAQVVNKWAEEYIKQSFDNRIESAGMMKDALHEEILVLKQKLESSEAELLKYGQAKNVSEQDTSHMKKLDELNQQMAAVEARLIANKYPDIQDATQENFPASLKTSAMLALESNLSNLKQNLIVLANQFRPASPNIIKLNAEIDEVQQQLADQIKQRIEQERIEYDLAQAHYKRLNASIKKQKERINQRSEDAIQYNILKRQVEIDKQLYQGVLARLGEVGITADLRTANIQIVDGGEVPSSPYSPDIVMNLVLGFAVGTVLGLLLVFVREYLDETLSSFEEVEQMFGLPSLAVIPSLGKSWQKTHEHLLTPSEDEPQEARLVKYINSMPLIGWESFRWLRMSLLFSSPDNPPRTILVTSSIPGEGKTMTSINLAISFAQMGARTVILDLDMRKPRVATRFKISEAQGLSSYLAGDCDLPTQVSETGILNLFVLPAGPPPANPPELIGSHRMELALEWLSQNFQYVIVDSPPLLAVTDAVMVAVKVDGVLLLVKAGKTPRDDVRRTMHILTGVGTRIFGIAVNGEDFYKVKSKYSYGYDS
jgi:capsular exopolysaccharide synthesis family protein